MIWRGKAAAQRMCIGSALLKSSAIEKEGIEVPGSYSLKCASEGERLQRSPASLAENNLGGLR